jgi:hypothetical protein
MPRQRHPGPKRVGNLIFIVEDEETSKALIHPLRAVGILPAQHSWLSCESVLGNRVIADSLAQARVDSRKVVAVGRDVSSAMRALGITCQTIASPLPVLVRGRVSERLTYIRHLRTALMQA